MAKQSTEEERPLKVVFASLAKYFTDAAPIGRSRIQLTCLWQVTT
jgi:hypothetical protein